MLKAEQSLTVMNFQLIKKSVTALTQSISSQEVEYPVSATVVAKTLSGLVTALHRVSNC